MDSTAACAHSIIMTLGMTMTCGHIKSQALTSTWKHRNGTPSTPYIFYFVASITAKLVEFIVYISIEGFRVLEPLHCL
jgi:hypothetical protein